MNSQINSTCIDTQYASLQIEAIRMNRQKLYSDQRFSYKKLLCSFNVHLLVSGYSLHGQFAGISSNKCME